MSQTCRFPIEVAKGFRVAVRVCILKPFALYERRTGSLLRTTSAVSPKCGFPIENTTEMLVVVGCIARSADARVVTASAMCVAPYEVKHVVLF